MSLDLIYMARYINEDKLKITQNSVEFGRIRPNSIKIRPNSTEFDRTSAEFGRILVEFGRIRPNFDGVRPNSAEFWLIYTHIDWLLVIHCWYVWG